MLLTSVAANTTLSEHQIQRNIQKLNFNFSGSKGAGTAAAAQLATDAAATFVSLKRVSKLVGEKTIIPRMTLNELLNETLGIGGIARTTGTDAAAAYTGDFAVELSLLGNVALGMGDYLALTVENATAGLTIAISAIAGTSAGVDHLKRTKTTLAANEFKRVEVNGADFVVLPNDLSEVKIVCANEETANYTSNTLPFIVNENSAVILNTAGGLHGFASAAVIDGSKVLYIDVTNGATARNIIVSRQTDY